MKSESRFSNITRFDKPEIVNLDFLPEESNVRNIIITKNALFGMYDHANGEIHHEVGGFLLGKPLIDKKTSTHLTYIEEIVEGVYDSTPTFVTIHSESFHRVEIKRKERNLILVGYYHSHPQMPIFQSGTDLYDFTNYFQEIYQIAIVINPCYVPRDYIISDLKWVGFYFWNNENKSIRLNNKNNIYITSVEKTQTLPTGEFKVNENLLNKKNSDQPSINNKGNKFEDHQLDNIMSIYIHLIKILICLLTLLIILMIYGFLINGKL
ncbi:MAG: M67 family metallopeptidase [Anaerolineaceae bacterium]